MNFGGGISGGWYSHSISAPWTPHEDHVLEQLVKAQKRNSSSASKKRKQQQQSGGSGTPPISGISSNPVVPTDWNAVAAALGGMRSSSECQDRWRLVEQSRPQFGHSSLGGNESESDGSDIDQDFPSLPPVNFSGNSSSMFPSSMLGSDMFFGADFPSMTGGMSMGNTPGVHSGFEYSLLGGHSDPMGRSPHFLGDDGLTSLMNASAQQQQHHSIIPPPPMPQPTHQKKSSSSSKSKQQQLHTQQQASSYHMQQQQQSPMSSGGYSSSTPTFSGSSNSYSSTSSSYHNHQNTTQYPPPTFTIPQFSPQMLQSQLHQQPISMGHLQLQQLQQAQQQQQAGKKRSKKSSTAATNSSAAGTALNNHPFSSASAGGGGRGVGTAGGLTAKQEQLYYNSITTASEHIAKFEEKNENSNRGGGPQLQQQQQQYYQQHLHQPMSIGMPIMSMGMDDDDKQGGGTKKRTAGAAGLSIGAGVGIPGICPPGGGGLLGGGGTTVAGPSFSAVVGGWSTNININGNGKRATGGGGRDDEGDDDSDGDDESSDTPKEKYAKKFYFTPDTDSLLMEAVQMYGRDWTKCAAHVGRGVTNRQCCMRYTRHVDPQVAIMKGKGPWTEEEDKLLAEYYLARQGLGRNGGTDWTGVTEAVGGRTVVDCKNRMKCLEEKSLIREPFTEAEDAIIVRMVQQWGDKYGKWNAISRELGRPSDKCMARWKSVLSKGLTASGTDSGAAQQQHQLLQQQLQQQQLQHQQQQLHQQLLPAPQPQPGVQLHQLQPQLHQQQQLVVHQPHQQLSQQQILAHQHEHQHEHQQLSVHEQQQQQQHHQQEQPRYDSAISIHAGTAILNLSSAASTTSTDTDSDAGGVHPEIVGDAGVNLLLDSNCSIGGSPLVDSVGNDDHIVGAGGYSLKM